MSTLLRRGSRGDAVVALQENLNHVPSRYVPTSAPRLVADGAFGSLTEERVRLFQRNAGLEIDGLVGPNTQASLEKALNEVGASVAAPGIPAAAPATPATTTNGSPNAPREVPRAE
jgi:peptidoglycan hydrolase-like protein with peptidoglycan-binding domain